MDCWKECEKEMASFIEDLSQKWHPTQKEKGHPLQWVVTCHKGPNNMAWHVYFQRNLASTQKIMDMHVERIAWNNPKSKNILWIQ